MRYSREEKNAERERVGRLLLASHSVDAQMRARRALCTMRSVILKLCCLETTSSSLQAPELLLHRMQRTRAGHWSIEVRTSFRIHILGEMGGYITSRQGSFSRAPRDGVWMDGGREEKIGNSRTLRLTRKFLLSLLFSRFQVPGIHPDLLSHQL